MVKISYKKQKVSNNKNGFLNVATNIVYFHHERWDGTGYPKRLKVKLNPTRSKAYGDC